MKIVYIFKSLAQMAGTERILNDKMRYLSEEMRHEVYVITYEQGAHPLAFPLPEKVKWIDINVRFFTIYKYGIIKRMTEYFKLRKQFRQRLEKLIREINPDILICTTYLFGELDIIANLPGKSKKILESHVKKTSVEKKFTAGGNPVRQLIAGYTDRRVLNQLHKFDAIVVLTDADKADWMPYTKFVCKIPNLLTYYPAQDNSYQLHKRVISAGRLHQQKGYDLLIHSWKIVHEKHPDWRLDIYGDGEEQASLLRLIETLGLKNVINIHEPTRQIYEEYMKSDFYVMSSRWEGFGLVLSEAMSCGIPCVSFNCPHGPSEVITDRVDGLLVEDGRIEQLAEKINYLIEHDDARIELGKKARENVKRYLPEQIMPEWNKLFKELLS